MVQSLLDILSARFVNRANAILDRLQQAAGILFEIPVEPVMIHCPLRVESHLYYRVERVFHSLDSFFLALPRFLLRPIVLGKMQAANLAVPGSECRPHPLRLYRTPSVEHDSV